MPSEVIRGLLNIRDAISPLHTLENIVLNDLLHICLEIRIRYRLESYIFVIPIRDNAPLTKQRECIECLIQWQLELFVSYTNPTQYPLRICEKSVRRVRKILYKAFSITFIAFSSSSLNDAAVNIEKGSLHKGVEKSYKICVRSFIRYSTYHENAAYRYTGRAKT